MSDAGRPDERAQATVLMLVVVLFAAIVAAGVARVGIVAADRAGAQAAADASALAGAAAGRVAAAEVAVENQATLVAFDLEDDDVVVTVNRSGTSATARARWVPAPIP